MFTLLNVGHLTSTETKRDLSPYFPLENFFALLIFVFKSFVSIFGDKTHFFNLNRLLLLLCLFFFTGLLILILSVIDNLAYRRFAVGAIFTRSSSAS